MTIHGVYFAAQITILGCFARCGHRPLIIAGYFTPFNLRHSSVNNEQYHYAVWQ